MPDPWPAKTVLPASTPAIARAVTFLAQQEQVGERWEAVDRCQGSQPARRRRRVHEVGVLVLTEAADDAGSEPPGIRERLDLFDQVVDDAH